MKLFLDELQKQEMQMRRDMWCWGFLWGVSIGLVFGAIFL